MSLDVNLLATSVFTLVELIKMTKCDLFSIIKNKKLRFKYGNQKQNLAKKYIKTKNKNYSNLWQKHIWNFFWQKYLTLNNLYIEIEGTVRKSSIY